MAIFKYYAIFTSISKNALLLSIIMKQFFILIYLFFLPFSSFKFIYPNNF